jgi:hypothetical protein
VDELRGRVLQGHQRDGAETGVPLRDAVDRGREQLVALSPQVDQRRLGRRVAEVQPGGAHGPEGPGRVNDDQGPPLTRGMVGGPVQGPARHGGLVEADDDCPGGQLWIGASHRHVSTVEEPDVSRYGRKSRERWDQGLCSVAGTAASVGVPSERSPMSDADTAIVLGCSAKPSAPSWWSSRRSPVRCRRSGLSPRSGRRRQRLQG